MNARDYFFTVVAPEQAGRSYQAAHQYDVGKIIKQSRLGIPPEEYAQAMEKAIGHIPNRSNDLLIERWMEELIRSVPDTLRKRLESMFVAKLRDFRANAEALCAEESYEGDLIFFNVGLSDLCLQYAIVYYESVHLTGERLSPKIARIEGLEEEFIEHISKLTAAQDRWDRLGEIRLTFEDAIFSSHEIESQAGGLAECANKFILCHEISHHILGHTAAGDRPLSFIENLPDHCKYWKRKMQLSHQQEYEADASAIVMTLKTHSLDTEADSSREFRAAIGALITLTVLGQLVGDVDNSTPSHPSVKSRFDQCLDILQATCKHETIRGIVLLIKRFQVLLWTIQRKGLGRHWAEAGNPGEIRREEQEYPSPILRLPVKVGRNEPCPCGSGKKFKKCHGGR